MKTNDILLGIGGLAAVYLLTQLKPQSADGVGIVNTPSQGGKNSQSPAALEANRVYNDNLAAAQKYGAQIINAPALNLALSDVISIPVGEKEPIINYGTPAARGWGTVSPSAGHSIGGGVF